MQCDLLVNTYVRLLNTFLIDEFISDDVAERLGFRKGYARNLLSGLMKQGYVSSRPDEKDRRRRLYRLEVKALDEVLSLKPSLEKRELETLKLFKTYRGEYVAVVNGEVVDHDEDLQALAKRVLLKYPLESLYITCVGTPRRMGILEF